MHLKGIHSTVTFLELSISWKFGKQNTRHRFRERIFKACLYTHTSLTPQTYVLFVSLPIRCQVKTYYEETLFERF